MSPVGTVVLVVVGAVVVDVVAGTVVDVVPGTVVLVVVGAVVLVVVVEAVVVVVACVVVVTAAWQLAQLLAACVEFAAITVALPWQTTHFARAGVSPTVAWHWVQLKFRCAETAWMPVPLLGVPVVPWQVPHPPFQPVENAEAWLPLIARATMTATATTKSTTAQSW
jgi:hypothetical protein